MELCFLSSFLSKLPPASLRDGTKLTGIPFIAEA